MKRHCGVCGSTTHDRRTCPRLVGKAKPTNYRKALRRHTPRRNPDSEQLGDAYGRALSKAIAASSKGNSKGERYWEHSAQRIEKVIDDPRKPYPKEFITVRNKFGVPIVIPRRYGLESENKYRHSEDTRNAARGKHRREADRLDRLTQADEETGRRSESHKRKLSYDAAKAKTDRERRKHEVAVSPTATKKVYEAAKAKAAREGKQLVERARRGGGNIAQQDYFARRTGN